MPTPPKSFHPIMVKMHTIGKKQNLGQCEPRNRYTKHNMKGKQKKHRNIYYKDYRRQKHMWWYINRRIRPPPKYDP